jgi:hypothetical protein
VTVQSLTVWLTISSGLAVAREVCFLGDGKEILRATLENKKGEQKLDLPQPATFRELTFQVHSTYPPEKLYWVSQGARELRGYAGRDKPLYVWIETQAGFFGDQTVPVTGLEIRNEVYQAIIQGATAIGYFTHRFKPTFAEFGVPEENQKALLEINQQLQRLAPVILSREADPPPAIQIEGGLAAQCMGREWDGHVYLFALNLDMDRQGGPGTITLDGLKAGTPVEVVDEGRTITARDGGFQDDFGPLAVHIYQIRR